jgi:hypothetical protein
LCEIPIGIDATKAARNRLYGRDRDAIAYGTVGGLNEVKVCRTDKLQHGSDHEGWVTRDRR